MEECSNVYFDQWIDEGKGDGYMPDGAYDMYKEKFSEFLTPKIGTKVPFTATESSGIVPEPTGSVADVITGVGKYNTAPSVYLSVKVANAGETVAYIGRNGQGIPVFAGWAKPKDGELRIGLKFDVFGLREHEYARHKALGSFTTIELMNPKELDEHIIYYTGPWGNYFRGVAKMGLKCSVNDIPESLPGLYNKKEDTSRYLDGPEDGYNLYELVLSQDDKRVAVVNYEENKNIYFIQILSPEMFILDRYFNSSPGDETFLTIHVASDPILVMHASRAKAIVDYNQETYLESPAVSFGVVHFLGIEVKDWKSYDNKPFKDADIVPGSHFTEITIQKRN